MFLTPRLAQSVACALAAAFVLPACSSGGAGERGALSKTSFARRTNRLCAIARSDRQRILSTVPANPSGATDADKFKLLVDIDRKLIRRVDNLVPPESEQEGIDRLLDNWRHRIAVEEEFVKAVAQKTDQLTLAAFNTRVEQIDADADPIARRLGTDECVRRRA